MAAGRKQPRAPRLPPDEPVHGRSAAVRTAWIIGAIALAFYIGALVQGHRGHLNTSWHKLPPASTAVQSPPAAGAVGSTARTVQHPAPGGHASTLLKP